MPFNLSGWELLLILGIGLLLFGSRLPMVGRNLGKGIVEFKKGIKGVTDEVEGASREVSREANRDNGNLNRRIEERSYRAPLGPGGDERRVSSAEPVEQNRQEARQ
jgi:sec-independent protein translocase protein TatA